MNIVRYLVQIFLNKIILGSHINPPIVAVSFLRKQESTKCLPAALLWQAGMPAFAGMTKISSLIDSSNDVSFLRSFLVLLFVSGILSAQTPTITSFSPTSATVGSTVTITGTNFSSIPANNVVYFGAVKGNVTTASTTSLSVTVPTGATFAPINVTVLGTNKTVQSKLPFSLSFQAGDLSTSSFIQSQLLSIGGQPLSTAITDMNDDGKPDLLISRTSAYPAQDTLSYLQNTSTPGNISFASAKGVPTGNYPATKILTGDFDSDGDQDFLFVSSAHVRVMRDIGTPGNPVFELVKDFTNPDLSGGYWSVETSYSSNLFFMAAGLFVDNDPFAVTDTYPNDHAVWNPGYLTNMHVTDAAVRDFNNDGKLDIAIGYDGNYNINVFGRLRIYLNTGSDFTLGQDIELRQSTYNNQLDMYSISTGDLNGDGRQDIVLTGNFNPFTGVGMLSVLMNTNYGFQPVSWDLTSRTERVVTADFDSDGKLDIAYQTRDDNKIKIGYNTSTIDSLKMSNSYSISSTNSQNSLQIADLNGDGKPDLVWSCDEASGYKAALNTSTTGSISFASPVHFLTSLEFHQGITVGDLDGNSKPDIVSVRISNGELSIVKNAIPSYSLSQSSINVTTPVISKNGTTQVSLQIKDVSGNNMNTSGLAVVFGLTGSGTSSGTFSAASYQGSGLYTSTFTGTAVGIAKNVTATIEGVSITSSLPTVTVQAGSISIANSTVTISRSTLVSASTATVMLQAKDANGDTLTTGGSTIVFFLHGSGTSSGSFGTVRDSSNGKYYSTFTASTSGTAKNIRARIGTDSTQTTPPTVTVNAGTFSTNNSVLTVASSSILLYDTTTITLQVKDGSGNNITTGGLDVQFKIFNSINPYNNGKVYLTDVVDHQNGTYSTEIIGIGTATPASAFLGYIYNPNPGYQTYQQVNSFPSQVTVNPRPISYSNSYVYTGNSSVYSGSQTYFAFVAKNDMNQPYTLQNVTIAMSLAVDGTMNGFATESIHYDGNGMYSFWWQGNTIGTPRSVIGTINGTSVTSAAPKLAVMPFGPGLTYPGYFATAVPSDTALYWNASSGATSYRIKIFPDSTTANPVVDSSGITGTSFSVKGLSKYRTYHWGVTSFLDTMETEMFVSHEFRTVVSSPLLSLPFNNQTSVTIPSILQWSASSGADSYTVQVAIDTAFSSIVAEHSGLTVTADTISGLANDTKYYWRMKSVGDGGESDYSLYKTFTSEAVLAVEMASFTVKPNRLTAVLNWATATETNNYGFEIQRSEVRSQKSEVNSHSDPDLSGEESRAWSRIGFVEGNGTTNAPKEYSFTDKNLKVGKYSYRLKQIDRDGNFAYTPEVEAEVGAAPKIFSLNQNYPNPFNPSTTIEFTLPEDGMVKLHIFNILGQRVATLLNNEQMKAGEYHQVLFNASSLASGVYFSLLEFQDKRLLKKMLLLK